jgi:hypothetical protein
MHLSIALLGQAESAWLGKTYFLCVHKGLHVHAGHDISSCVVFNQVDIMSMCGYCVNAC